MCNFDTKVWREPLCAKHTMDFYICQMKQPPGPLTTYEIESAHFLPHVGVSCVVFGFHANTLRVLLMRWLQGDIWNLPGGVLFQHESLDEAAHRVLEARTGLTGIFMRQFHAFGDAERNADPAVQGVFAQMGVPERIRQLLSARIVAVGYYALVDYSKVNAVPDFPADECHWMDVREVPKLAFDHNNIVDHALQKLRKRLDDEPVGMNLLPEEFTMPELQRLHEAILGRHLDRANFQKQMLASGLLERVGKRQTGAAHKAPFLYRFRKV